MAKKETSANTCGLYLISPPYFKLLTFRDQLKSALEGFSETPGAADHAAFQLRLKQGDDDDILRAVDRLKPVCDDAGVVFILNDRPDLVTKSGAGGVHLGSDDGASKPGYIAEVRKQLGPKAVIGASCYDSKHLAMEAAEEGADYVSFGAFFESSTKKDPKGHPTKEILEWWTTYTVVPCVAIGGITPENCGDLVRAGADFIAAISAIWTAADSPREAVKDFLTEIDRAKAGTLKH